MLAGGKMIHTRKWESVCPKLRRLQEIARTRKEEKFTSLAHYLTEEALTRSYRSLDGKAAAGVDGVTKESYGKDLTMNIKRLHESLKSGAYRATPSRRQWIGKADGSKRPLGIPALEDKIVQGAVVEILNCVYEADFLGFSYGFRPGRSAHKALQALQTVLQKGRVNWALEVDIKGFFDNISHKELMSMLERRVVDGRILRLIGKWLCAGVVEKDGSRTRGKMGTPQGGVISPLLANVFLHYVVDEFVHGWRKTEAKGEVYIVRYADDFVIACEREDDARKLLALLTERLAAHGLSVNTDKTRLLRFGRGGDSDTFDFLGFTHIAGKDGNGKYLVRRKTSRKRFARSLKAVLEWCCDNRHKAMSWQWRELSLKLRGHYNYYGIRGNYEMLAKYRQKVWEGWMRWLRRRSQKSAIHRVYTLLKDRFVLPAPKITHPDNWFDVNPGHLLGRAGCGNAARPVL